MRGVTDSSLTPSSWRVARGVCRLEIAHVSAVFTARDGARHRRPTRAGTRGRAAGPITVRPFTLYREAASTMIWMILIANPFDSADRDPYRYSNSVLKVREYNEVETGKTRTRLWVTRDSGGRRVANMRGRGPL